MHYSDDTPLISFCRHFYLIGCVQKRLHHSFPMRKALSDAQQTHTPGRFLSDFAGQFVVHQYVS